MPVDATTIADQLLLGRYRVLEERGKGGFGTVSVCWDPRLMRRVAIKAVPLHMAEPVVRPARRKARPPQPAGQPAPAGYPGSPFAPRVPDEPDPAQVERRMLLRAALSETRTASMLAHPGIVSMLDFESDDDNAYIIMEYVEGASLAELLDATEDGLLTADEAAAVVEAVTDALQFAHDNGVLHLDIKPDNILVDMSGRVKLADFGMAALSSATGYAGARGGTVGYMPPEQIRCEDVDVRTDVFAFASVMYEALTGVRPFAAGKLSESLELVERGAADPCALNESVSPAAADALLVALDPDPAVRPVSAEAFGDELLAGLGRAKAGRKSLAAFVADVMDDSRAPDPASENPAGPAGDPHAGADRTARPSDPELGPLSNALPRAGVACLRVLAALGSGAAAGLAVQTLAPADPPTGALAALAAVAALGGVAPQLGYALALAALAVACLAARLWAFAAALMLGGAAWWVLVGRVRPRASAPAFAAALTPAGSLPVAPLLCGWLLPAGPAACSAALGFAVFGALTCLSGAHELGSYTLAGFARFFAGRAPLCAASLGRSWDFWLTGAAWVASAAAMGALCHNGSKNRCYLGCLVGCAVISAFQMVIGRMENGGSWATLAPEVAACAAGSTILVALCVFLFGSPRALAVDAEGEGTDTNTAREGV